ncbi:MAG TPA: hypothetical protein VFP72_08150 [Kineosporiaceae bacterium]|nr:hypothetical protein [Kineosporiaceae bacterium]
MVSRAEFAEEAQAAVEARAQARRARVERGELTPQAGMGSMDEWRLDLGGYQLYLTPLSGDWLYLDPVHQTIEPTGYRCGEVTFGVLDGTLGARLRERQSAALPAPPVFPSAAPAPGPPTAFPACPAPAAGPPPPPRAGHGRRLLQLLSLVPLLFGLATTGIGVYRLVSSRGTTSERPPATQGTAAPGTHPATAPTAPPVTLTEPAPTTTAAPTEAAPPPTRTATAKPSTTTTVGRCRNRAVGYSLTYPAGWHVASGPDGTCQYFNPTPFQVPKDAEVAVAIVVYEMPDDFGTATSQFTQPGLIDILQQKRTTVAGHRALRIVYRDQSESGTSGAKNCEVLVDHNNRTLALAAHAPFSADFATTQKVLDAMAASLSFSS